MNCILVPVASLLLFATTVFAAEPAPRRVGNGDIDRRAVFAVAAAPQGRDLHFIYAVDGRQYVVITATGGQRVGGPSGAGDAYVAFALPR